MRGEQAAFPFGHGLSYTRFEYSRLTVKKQKQRGQRSLTISLTLKNTGRRAGEEVVQLYLRDEFSRRTRPLKELKNFKRIALSKGEKTRVSFTLSQRDLEYLGEDMTPVFEPGRFEIMIGASSGDIRLSRLVQVD